MPSAQADPSQNEADSTAAVIAAVAPNTESTVTPAVGATGATAAVGDVAVSLPTTSDGVVMLSSTDPNQQILHPVTISLPKEIVGKHAAKSKSGLLVYSDPGQATDAVAQVLADGSVRLQTVTFSAKGTQKFTYTIGNATPVLQADGSVALIQTIPSASALIQATVATIAPAWARGADGVAVATHYEVNGKGQLVQVIKPNRTTKYPVVADPALVSRTWYGYVVQFDRTSTYNIKTGASLTGAGGGAVAVLLGVTGVAAAGILFTAGVYAAVADWAYGRGSCLQVVITFPLVSVTPTSYSGGFCR